MNKRGYGVTKPKVFTAFPAQKPTAHKIDNQNSSKFKEVASNKCLFLSNAS